MKVIAINGSPRKKWNTATLLEKALEGAASSGAQTKLIHLYDLDYKGCKSCFACKLPEGKSYGHCALDDDLTQVLAEIETADAVILGSPIYYGSITGEMRSFLERLQFQYLQYDKAYSSLFNGRLSGAFLYTMNVNERVFSKNYRPMLEMHEGALKRTLKLDRFYTVVSTDTCQFDDYAKYEITAFDPVSKKKRQQEEFPRDCARAFELGVKLAKK